MNREAVAADRINEKQKLFEGINQYEVVFACFAGHDHAGGYVFDNGIHHVTFNGMVESPDNNAYALVEFYDGVIRIRGFRDQPSHDLMIKQN